MDMTHFYQIFRLKKIWRLENKMTTLNDTIYTILADKLEAPEPNCEDLLVEAVGNDDGDLRAAIYRLSGCSDDDLKSARESMNIAFIKYFKIDDLALDEINENKGWSYLESLQPKGELHESGHSYKDFA